MKLYALPPEEWYFCRNIGLFSVKTGLFCMDIVRGRAALSAISWRVIHFRLYSFVATKATRFLGSPQNFKQVFNVSKWSPRRSKETTDFCSESRDANIWSLISCMSGLCHFTRFLDWFEVNRVYAHSQMLLSSCTWIFLGEVGGWGRVPFSRNLTSPTPRRKWYLTTGRRAH